ncbi:MAG: imidazolonepropionase [Acidimicrobiales bacterium]|jgi:imidazolonepropionase
MGAALLLRSIGRLFTAGRAGTIDAAAVVVRDGLIAYAGPEASLPAELGITEEVDLGGALVTPGLIDAHTHPLYGGNRFAEIALRSSGASYAEIAAAGGGIASTVTATRATSADRLAADARERLRSWLAGGTTTVETKTGYLLDESGESEAVRILAGLGGDPALPSLEVTWLAGHGVGPEFAGDADGYIEAACQWCEGARAAGARHADVFCDEGYFTVEQSRRLLRAAAGAGMLPRIHADELARTGGARLAAELNCSSADHLLCVQEDDARALAGAGVVATLAPVTALAMGRRPPVRTLLDAGVTIALGSDHNPGTCGTTSMSFVVALGVAELGLSVAASLTAATAGGAASLRRADRGRVEAGLRADLVAWKADHEGAFAWSYGLRPLRVFKAEPIPTV